MGQVEVGRRKEEIKGHHVTSQGSTAVGQVPDRAELGSTTSSGGLILRLHGPAGVEGTGTVPLPAGRHVSWVGFRAPWTRCVCQGQGETGESESRGITFTRGTMKEEDQSSAVFLTRLLRTVNKRKQERQDKTPESTKSTCPNHLTP
jgi:hypothetical protein